MKLIIPMAGRGTRMRPHTLTVPKPLIPVAGKTIVERLIYDINKTVQNKISEIHYVIGDFGEETENTLKQTAEKIGAKGFIHYQKEALGTAHAVYCAADGLNGEVIIAFADTLFIADFKIDNNQEGIIWVKKIPNPEQFGVVKLNEKNEITDFVEKPQEFVSDLAIIGIYYFKHAEKLKKEIENILNNDIKTKGEYGLTDALENLKSKGLKFKPATVKEWLDCGNKDATINTNKRILVNTGSEINKTIIKQNSVIIEPCFIGNNVELNNSIIGPYVSIGEGSAVKNSIIENTIIQNNSNITNCVIGNSMIGNYVEINNKSLNLNIGDYTKLDND